MDVGIIDAICDPHIVNVIVEQPRTSASVAVASVYWASNGFVPTQFGGLPSGRLFGDVGAGLRKINIPLTHANLIERGGERLMSKMEIAQYCGCKSFSTLNNWIRRGIIPRPIPGTQRFDRKALDLSLDKASGLQTSIAGDPLGEWQANRARSAKRNS